MVISRGEEENPRITKNSLKNSQSILTIFSRKIP
jgi:hypothetical protein